MSESMTEVAVRRPELITVGEAATRLGRTEAALRFMIHNGTAPRSALIGGRRMFRDADVDAYIAEAFGDAAAVIDPEK